MAVTDEKSVHAVARDLYVEATANDPVIHCNRFPNWEELSDSDKEPWIQKALGNA